MQADTNFNDLALEIKQWSLELGFQQIGIAGIELPQDEAWLMQWLARHRHGEMSYMARHGRRRARPQELSPGTIRVISARMDYLPEGMQHAHEVLEDATLAYVSRYALGRD